VNIQSHFILYGNRAKAKLTRCQQYHHLLPPPPPLPPSPLFYHPPWRLPSHPFRCTTSLRLDSPKPTFFCGVPSFCHSCAVHGLWAMSMAPRWHHPSKFHHPLPRVPHSSIVQHMIAGMIKISCYLVASCRP
jgi:hypothetical protein